MVQESTLISNSELRYSKHPALTDIVKERDLPVTLIDIMESEPKEDAANQVHPRSYRAELRFILIVEPIPALDSDRWVAQHFRQYGCVVTWLSHLSLVVLILDPFYHLLSSSAQQSSAVWHDIFASQAPLQISTPQLRPTRHDYTKHFLRDPRLCSFGSRAGPKCDCQ
jgi:hypothetical protein